jgi:zinc protease
MSARVYGSALALVLLGVVGRLTAQEPAPGRDAALALEFPALEFDPPEPELHTLSGGVEVLHLEDRTLPLVNVFARFEGGYARFDRAHYAAGTSLASLLRSGGTASLSPDSVDLFLEREAVQTSFGGGGESVTASLNVLRDGLPAALAVWGEMLRAPRFAPERVEVWRGQELESALRRLDDPQRLAFSEFNRLMYGDHPIGWEMAPEDLEPEDLSLEKLTRVHRRVVCPGNLILGVTGDASWEEVRPLLEDLLEGWPACPEALPESPVADIREGGGVFLIPRDLEQSTVVMAHATDVRQGDHPAFFSSRIGNLILGAGGFSSRLLSRVRTERGYAYSAGSLWTTPREQRGLVGAVTQTRPATTVAAIRLILETIDEMTREEPASDEVERAIEETVNGFVFNFQSPSQIVFRRMLYRADELPEDWLQRYLEGIQEVDPARVLEVFREHVRPEEMTILVVGNPEGFDEPLDALGPVTILEIEEASSPSSPSGGPRSPG